MGKRADFLFGRRGRSRGWRVLLLVVVALLVGGAALWPSLHDFAREVVARSGLDRVEGRVEDILFAARESGQDPLLLAAVMYAESGGRIAAHSSADAYGLLQLRVPTAGDCARRLGLPPPAARDLLRDARLNVRLGATYLSWLSRRYDGHLEKMLIAYNAGPGRLDGWIREAGGYDRWREERERAGDSQVLAYVRKVNKAREIFLARGRISRIP